MATIYFTVTNNLSYDQRMIRICDSLSRAGFEVVLIGRKEPNSPPLQERSSKQKRLGCWFYKGYLFYAEYNLRLFFFLLFKKMDIICSIDLDTILPCLLVSKIRGIKRVYDAHELFCEMKEIATRPRIYRFWKRIESIAVPRFSYGYTVNEPIADEFQKMYGVRYEIIRSISKLRPLENLPSSEPYFLYQGAVNEGRCFETLIPAMKNIPNKLLICGDGNFMEQARKLVVQHQLEDKVLFVGKKIPEELWKITQQAFAGFTLFDTAGKSNYYSLANRFFDYMHAGIPQICVNYPVYAELNNSYSFALMVNDVSSETLESAMLKLIQDKTLYDSLKQNALQTRQQLNWQQEEKKLISFYQKLVSS